MVSSEGADQITLVNVIAVLSQQLNEKVDAHAQTSSVMCRELREVRGKCRLENSKVREKLAPQAQASSRLLEKLDA